MMKWVDYREKLKIGFDDRQKFKMLSAILKNYVGNVVEENLDEDSYFSYCQMVGEDYLDFYQPYQCLQGSLDKAESIYELVAKYIAFCNTYSAKYTNYSYNVASKGQVLEYLKKSLEKLNIKVSAKFWGVVDEKSGDFPDLYSSLLTQHS